MIRGDCVSLQGGATLPDEYILRTITSISNTKAKYVGERAFSYCTVLAGIYLPNVTEIGSFAFSQCYRITSLTTDSFPNLETIGEAAFTGCSRLVSVSLPKVTEIGKQAFQSCSNLESATFQACTHIGNYAFNASKSGFVIHILADSVCTIGTNIFNSNLLGAIYVPSNLVDSYKAASGWSAYADKIFAEP